VSRQLGRSAIDLIREAERILQEGNVSTITSRKEITDHAIHQLLARNDRATKLDEIFDAFGRAEEVRRKIIEKLSMMARFGLIVIKGDLVTIKQKHARRKR